jgi:hypothetical protein
MAVAFPGNLSLIAGYGENMKMVQLLYSEEKHRRKISRALQEH